MPARFEPPDVRSFGNLRFIVGRKIPLIFVRVALPEMRRLVIIWSVFVVEQFESRETTLYVQNQQLPSATEEIPVLGSSSIWLAA